MISLQYLPLGFSACVEYIRQNSGRVIVVATSSSFICTKIDIILREHGIYAKQAKFFSELVAAKSGVFLADLKIKDAFVANGVLFIPDEVFIGKKLATNDSSLKKTRSDIISKRRHALQEGCFVVHRQYGIGRFEGMELVTVMNIVHECLKIVYADNARLFVPVEHIGLVTKYDVSSDDDSVVQLDSLRSNSWNSRKKRTESKIQELAARIIRLAAERKRAVAQIYDPATRGEVLRQIERSFFFVETEDQVKAIEATYADLCSGKIMNRLVCGDVGFGKTEVAIRAAFLVACGKACGQNYSQVAMLCPAVFLAGQHYENISKRFGEIGLRVELLSRFVDRKKANQIKKDLAEGRVDVIVGTHALLQDDIAFKNLGLIICDEEQLFGVAHKEKLKALSAKAHLLTITATPIPRTLQSALYGITDLSVLSAPPFGRRTIKTEIVLFKKDAVHDILLKEKQSGGQSIVITPKIADIPELTIKIKSIMPSMSVGVMHGQLGEKGLGETINAFYEKHYDILIATTIIATGMDFGNSNTIIINKPEYFGLAQLYQIRGRVGRRDRQAYCYLLTTERTQHDKETMKKLLTLQSFNYSGSSVAISSADLDIRGGGNLLGKDQSGVMSEIGPELYYEMLQDAINNCGKRETKSFDINVDLGKSVYIPKEYIVDAATRIEFYHKIADIETHEDVINLKAEMIDRFGGLPGEIETLFEIADIKQICRQYGICDVRITKSKIRIKFAINEAVDVEKIMSLVSGNSGYKILPDMSVEIAGDFGANGPDVEKLVANIIRC